MRRFLLFGVASMLAAGTMWSADDGALQSASYRLQSSTINAGGGPSASATRRAAGTLAQAATIGTSSAPHFIIQSGFWGLTGNGLVPVVLTANRSASSVELTWSGNNAPYDVYRAESCASIFSSVLVTTSNNGYTDGTASGGPLTCYSVLATAPGPLSAPSP